MTNYTEELQKAAKSQKAAWCIFGKVSEVTCLQPDGLFPAVLDFPALSDRLQLELTSAARGTKLSEQAVLGTAPFGTPSLTCSETKPRRAVAGCGFLCLHRRNRVPGKFVMAGRLESVPE